MLAFAAPPLRVPQLVVQLAFIVVAGLRAEQLVLPSTTRVGWALLAALLVSGTCVSFGSLMMYLSTTDEAFLYKPLWGTGPVVAALSVAAHQVLGDAPIFPTHAPGLSFSLLPLVAVVVAAVSQFGVLSSRDFIATCVSLGAAWVYLRWVHVYAPGVVGDTRDEFDFLSMVPNPFRCGGGIGALSTDSVTRSFRSAQGRAAPLRQAPRRSPPPPPPLRRGLG